MKEIATAVPYDPDSDSFLVAKRNMKTSIHPGKWNFPGGHIEDENIREAALRELREETNLIGEVIKSGDSFVVDTEDGKFRIHPFLILVEGEPELNSEHTEYRWIEPEELEGLETVKGLEKDLESVGVI
ncbi:MAG: NUDIX domain-containing protein [Candidatus Nanohaloarchaea archaeon]